MTREEEDLLLKDLSTRLPYSPRVEIDSSYTNAREVMPLNHSMLQDVVINNFNVIPYLRPMSSMTEEEKRELQSFYPGSFGNQWLDVEKREIDIFECGSTIKLYLNDSVEIVVWLNSHHFDYGGLIEKGLALPAPKGMYNVKENNYGRLSIGR